MHRVAGWNYRTLVLGLSVVVLAGLVLGAAGIGTVAGAVGHSAGTGSASSPARASPTPAAQNVSTTSITIGIVSAPGPTFPTNVTFYTNITTGVISNTSSWVAVIASGPTETLVATGNGTVNSHGISTFVANGVTYANYTWVVYLTESTLTCTDASCSDLIDGAINAITFTVWASENGASAGGGWASNTYGWSQDMQSTYSWAFFGSPQTSLDTYTAAPYFQPVNISVEFAVNTSYLFLSNATFDVNLWVGFVGTTSFATNLSLNDTLNTTNTYGGASSILFNGTVNGVLWSNVSYSLLLDYTALGFASFAALSAALGTGGTLALVPWVNALGASSGGINAGVGDTGAGLSVMETGTTLLNGGTTDAPIPFQPLPYTQTGWLNLSFVDPDYATTGNATVTGFFQLYDTNFPLALPIATYSLNNSVNTTDPDGVSLIPMMNGTTATGTPFINYTWSLTIAAADLDSSYYGDPIALLVNVSADGTSVGGVVNLVSGVFVFPPTPLAQHPTTVSAVFTTAVTGYIDVSSGAYDLNWTITTNGPITPTQTFLSLAIIDATLPAPISWVNLTAAPGQTSYTVPLTASMFSTCTNAPICPYTAPTDDFYFAVSVFEDGIGAPTNGSFATTTVSIGPAFFIGTDATILLIAPQGIAPTLYIGNVTFATLYSGQYISGANLTVFSSSGVVVFTALMTQLTPGVPATAVWPATSPGVYTVVVEMTRTSGGPVYANSTLTLQNPTSGLVYQNSSTYHNVTLLGSLSPAVAGTILLLVGLIVGMIVALLVGRMMWGGSKPQEAPQAWQPGSQPGGSGGGMSGSEMSGGETGGGSSDMGTPPSGGT
jgi:hypothetical protein